MRSPRAGRPCRSAPIPLDVREFDQVDAVLDQVLEQHGRIDLLVNNAGGQFLAPAESVSPNGFRAVTRLNLDAMWYLTTRVAARSMIPNGYGKVVSVTMTPQRGIPYMAHSSAARAAVESLTQTLAVEWGQYGIRIVAVAPGIVHTEAWEGYGLDPAHGRRVDAAEAAAAAPRRWPASSRSACPPPATTSPARPSSPTAAGTWSVRSRRCDAARRSGARPPRRGLRLRANRAQPEGVERRQPLARRPRRPARQPGAGCASAHSR